MLLNIAEFRTAFPEFRDSAVYPNTMITMWANLAERQVRFDVWGESQALGIQLYTAHEIVLAAANAKAGAIGGTPGSSGGVAASKTVGSVSVSYDSANTSELNAGYWNLTNYGKQFIRLARIFGAGCIQL